jgi:hypothetical protein
MIFNESQKARTIELIKSIQAGEAGSKEMNELERVTGFVNAAAIFQAYELEGMLPGRIYDMFFSNDKSVPA